MVTISENGLIIEDKTYTGNLYARQQHPDGRPYHTFRTQSVLVDGDDITFRRCRFENTAGPGEKVGQAIALYLDGDGIVLEDCDIIGHQDSLFLAPLPPKEIEEDGFLGPKQYAPRTPREYRFTNCRIYGGVDFIFGGAAAVFEGCEFISVEPGYVFAPCTPEGQDMGFTIRNCRFVPDMAAWNSGIVTAGSCYIARPWREFAKVRLENCYLGEHINPAGWDDWGKTDAHDTILFEEYDSYGPGYVPDERPPYVIH